MRKLLCLCLCLLLCGCTAAPQTQSDVFYSFTDDTGAEIVLSQPPRKTAVLLSSLADLWQSAGGTVDITVGESVERGFAESGVLLVDSGAGKTIHVESLIAAQPDFVLYSADLSGQLECAGTLAAAGIPAAGFTVETFDDYLRVLKIATDILGTPERYEACGVQVRSRIEELLALANAQPQPGSYLFVRASSTAKSTKAKNADNHFVCAMLDELGAVNVADSAPVLLDGLSTEQIVRADPAHILYTTMGAEDAAVSYMESLLTDPVWGSLSAVQSGQVHHLPKELFQYKPNARWAEAYAYLIELLYGDIL